jgi:hypothetical protein
MFAGPNFGIKVGAQFTPTYIKSDSAGWWCDPYGAAMSSAMRSTPTSSISPAA